MRENLLIIHQGALGDLILSFPALLSLREQRKASLCLLCSNDLGRIAYRFNVVDAYVPLESARFSTLFSGEMTPFVKAFLRDYDTIVLISFSDRIEQQLRRNQGRPVVRIHPRPPVEEKTHVTLSLIGELQASGLIGNDSGRVADACGGRRQRGMTGGHDQNSRIGDRGPGSLFYLIHPGAGSPRKRWPIENFVQLAVAIERKHFRDVAFVLGPAEADERAVLKAGNIQVYDDCNLMDLTTLLEGASCYIGHDSGVTHLASFMRIPTIAIFGPSDPKRWSPTGASVKVLRAAENCPPCFETDSGNCSDPQCLKGVSLDMVLEAVRDFTPI